MIAVAGTILRVEIMPEAEISNPSELAALPVTATVYVADPGNTPFPGLGILMEGTTVDDVGNAMANTKADLYNWATTGEPA